MKAHGAKRLKLGVNRLLSFPGVGFRYINLYQNLKEAHMP